MNTIDRSQLIEQVLKHRRAPQAQVRANLPALPVKQAELPFEATETRAPDTVLQGLAAAQPKLMSETLDTLEHGFRRTQVFRQSDGRSFIRNEEVTLTERGMARIVTQDNPSGSRVRFEENLDRQADGNFRRSVRYTDETGGTQTRIDEAKGGINRFILSGGSYAAPASPYEAQRGHSVDISA